MRFFDWVWTGVFFSFVLLHHLDGIIQKDKESIIYDQIDVLAIVMFKIDDSRVESISDVDQRVKQLETIFRYKTEPVESEK